MPSSPNQINRMPAANDEAAILARLLPSRIAPIRRSGFSKRRLAIAARLSPPLSSAARRAAEAAVSAVSLPEKKKEATRQTKIATMMMISIVSMGQSYLGTIALGVEQRANPLRLYVRRDNRLPDAPRQHEHQRAAAHLLVLRHEREQTRRRRKRARDVLQPRRKSGRGEMRGDPVRVLGVAELELRREAERQHHADGDGLAVQQPVGKPGCGFERMAERVAQVEERPLAALALVAADELGFCPTRRCDRRNSCVVPREHVRPVGLEPGKEGFVAEQPVFSDLRIA